MDILSEKLCSKCKTLKPTSEYYKAKDAWCKTCHKLYAKEVQARKRQENPDALNEIQRRYYERNKEKCKADFKKQRQKRMQNPELAEKERQRCKEKAKRERATKPDVIKTRLAKSRDKHREKIQAHQREHKRRKYAENPDAFKARTAKQRASRAGIPGSWTGHDILALFKKQQGCCAYCGKKVGGGRVPFDIDHFIPISKGGTNYPENLKVACEYCNASKHDKLPWEWMPEKFQAPES